MYPANDLVFPERTTHVEVDYHFIQIIISFGVCCWPRGSSLFKLLVELKLETSLPEFCLGDLFLFFLSSQAYIYVST